MLLEDYLDFVEPDVIRIKGHRIGLEDVIDLYHQGYSAEQVALEFPSLTLEEIYATFAYYLHNKAEVDAYLQRLEEWVAESIREQERSEPPEVVKRIRALRESREQYNASK
ncbi:DUF433 domain-containing protein [Promineifilum sp.]|uniref:DUF433 domain-containing protein n=1 Tax=Promineifilum sp. TaxID=2664178 RepID=UPI0035B06209